MGVDRLLSGSDRVRLMVDRRTYSSPFATETEAREWLVVTRGRVVAARAAQNLTVEDYACRWLGAVIDTATGIDRYRRDVAEHILPALGSCLLVEVKPAEIGALLERVGTAASAAAAEQLRVMLRELSVDAVDEGIITRSPVPASRRRAQPASIY